MAWRSCAACPVRSAGALVMNAGAHGGEIKDALSKRVESTGRAPAMFSRTRRWVFPIATAWRRTTSCSPARRFRAARASPRRSKPRWSGSPAHAKPRSRSARRPAAQPSRTRRDMKAWELIDKAGCRGLRLGGAQVSTMHCNFLINLGNATAADLEALGEEVGAGSSRRAGSRSNGKSSASAPRWRVGSKAQSG